MRISTLERIAWAAVAWVVFLMVVRAAVAAEPLVIEIWPGKVPDESGGIGPERVRMSPQLDRQKVEVTEPTRMITDVTKPTISIYRPPLDKDTGTAILIFPGGGYWDLYLATRRRGSRDLAQFDWRDWHHPQVSRAAPA